MRCPFCNEPDTRVIDSRDASEGDQIRRRRECTDCKERFTTYETAELSFPKIVKSDGRREAFLEEKLRAGLMRALEKCPVEMDAVEASIEKIKRQLRKTGEREIDSQKVGDWVMEQLRDLDQVAYVRFASVYRSFEDVRAFLDEIERLEDVLPPEVKKDLLDLNSAGKRAKKVKK